MHLYMCAFVATVLTALALPALGGTNITYAEILCANQPTVYYCMTVHEIANRQNRARKNKYRWSELFRDTKIRTFLQRLNRHNARLKRHTQLAFPRDGAIDIEHHRPFSFLRPDIHARTILYDPALLAWALYDETGMLLDWGPGVGGARWCSDIRRPCRTVVGRFEILHKHDEDHRSNLYPLGCKGTECAHIPHMLTFENSGYGFHGSYGLPGYHASHGCVRLFPEDAQRLHGAVQATEPAIEETEHWPGIPGVPGTEVWILPYP